MLAVVGVGEQLGDTSRSSVLAVFKLITSSYFAKLS
jgi:hypothetical protein